jgi:hypothetical protein
MPDLQNFSRTFLGASNVNVPRVQIAATVTDSTTGAVLADFTGANVIIFPAVMSTLTQQQRQKIADMIAMTLVLMRAGFDDGSQ